DAFILSLWRIRCFTGNPAGLLVRPPLRRARLPDLRRSCPMGRDTLSDLLGTVRLRAAVFYYVSCWRNWATEAPPACEIAAAVMPGADHVMAFHMVVRGSGWAAVSGEPPLRLATGDIVVLPHGDAHVMSSAPGLAAERLQPAWVFANRDAPRPIPV